MKIGFTFTNYNNSRLSIQAARSIEANHGDCEYEIILVDNASIDEERHILAEPGELPERCSIIWNSRNVGYFDGLNIGMAALQALGHKYDAIVIGNNDLVFEREFFDGLKRRLDVFMQHSVVAPNIITLDHVHQNPHVISGISRFREFVWDLYFSNFIFSQLINWLVRRVGLIAKRKDYYAHCKEGAIYQGYGACYIMAPTFFQKYGRLWSPGFLMGEEFYLSRQLASRGEKMYYVPDILVRHHDHASIGKLPSRQLWDITRQYHKIYRYFISPYTLKMDSGKTPADFDQSVYSKK